MQRSRVNVLAFSVVVVVIVVSVNRQCVLGV
jgi:hypothetical protein